MKKHYLCTDIHALQDIVARCSGSGLFLAHRVVAIVDGRTGIHHLAIAFAYGGFDAAVIRPSLERASINTQNLTCFGDSVDCIEVYVRHFHTYSIITNILPVERGSGCKYTKKCLKQRHFDKKCMFTNKFSRAMSFLL